MNDVFIVAMARTPMGSFMGKLSTLSAPDLGAIALKAALAKIPSDQLTIDEVFMGNVISANIGQAPAKQVVVKAGLGNDIPCTIINKVCSSGLKAVMLGAQTIMSGQNDVVVAGGMESMSNIPHYIPNARKGFKFGHTEMVDGLVKDGLWEPYNDFAMGNCAENTAEEMRISRSMQDDYAIESYSRAQKAQKEGKFKMEITPVAVPNRRGPAEEILEDEEPSHVKLEKIPSLRTVFKKDGTVTAANASTINDGAAVLVLMSAEAVKKHQVKPLAKIVGMGDASNEPIWFTTAPTKAINKAINKANLQLSDIDFFEINEAFSAVAIANLQQLNLSPSKVNVYGGAVALGHPLGCSGARILCTLLSVLHQENGKLGVAGICNGGGGASALIVEKV
ncbi:acetyl-CoA C-acyltransferase [Persicobacter psychrovividus]|uniref:acetyl-CoA C-acetyltransferase n=1 Tax=Persicobacter psychrovividus TaxID=387638 RepID=A0ABN6LAV8_9BACT|nr:acetyl-CoA acetyltransferase [Persicobacter psychrovividus]